MSTYSHLGHFIESVVISDGANNGDNLASTGGLIGQLRHLGQGNGGPVYAGHEQSLHDNFVELGVGAPRQEAVELEEQVSSLVICTKDHMVKICNDHIGMDMLKIQ